MRYMKEFDYTRTSAHFATPTLYRIRSRVPHPPADHNEMRPGALGLIFAAE